MIEPETIAQMKRAFPGQSPRVEILEQFDQLCKSDLEHIQLLVAGENDESRSEIDALAHKILGRARATGALVMADAARELESAANSASWDEISDSLKKVADLHTLVVHELKRLLLS